MSAQPKEPRRAPTREEFERLLCNTIKTAPRAAAPLDVYQGFYSDTLAAYDLLVAERDEWKRRAEESQSEAVRIAQVHQHEWVMRASAREAFENYVVRVMAASGADSNFDDCFRNIIVEYDKSLARVDKAEAERDALKAALQAQGEIRLDIRGASDLRLRVGVLLQRYWKTLTNEQLNAIKAVCDKTAPARVEPPKDPRIAAWRALDAEQREIVLDLLRGAPQLKTYSEPTRRALGDAAACLEALGEK